MRFALLLALPLLTAAQTPVKPDALPEVPATLQTDYFAAYSDKADADRAVEQAQQKDQQMMGKLQGVIAQIQAVCGTKARAARYPDQHNGRVFCEAVPAKTEPKK